MSPDREPAEGLGPHTFDANCWCPGCPSVNAGLQQRIQAIINNSSADARLCADDPDFHIPLAERLVDLVLAERAEAVRLCSPECGICGGVIFWQDCPTGGWWYHDVHPDDGHDAHPGGS